MSEQEQEITLDQATEALLEVNTTAGAAGLDDEQVPVEVSAPEQPEVTPEPAPEPQAVEGEAGTEAVTEPEPEEPNADMQALEKRFDERTEAMRTRYEENQRVLQDRFLRKSTEGDRVAKALESSLTEEGLDREEARRLISQYRGTMNPASQSYAPPPQQQPNPASEDQSIVLNNFLNDKGMTADDANEFGNWVRTEAATAMPAAEQAVAQQSLDGFLRLAHGRWEHGQSQSTKEAKRNDAVEAVRSVQRTQKAAARAASSKPSAPITQPPSPKPGRDLSKLTSDDLSDLFRQSVEQYK